MSKISDYLTQKKLQLTQLAQTIGQNRTKVVFLSLGTLLAISASLFTLTYFKFIKNPLRDVPFLQARPQVSLETEYQNPFDKKTQYVNPFQSYKNPFAIAK